MLEAFRSRLSDFGLQPNEAADGNATQPHNTTTITAATTTIEAEQRKGARSQLQSRSPVRASDADAGSADRETTRERRSRLPSPKTGSINSPNDEEDVER